MANYQKAISYLDYLENGMKIRNAGFVRTEEKNGQMRLEVRMRNLPDIFNGQYDLHADSGGVIGSISLNRGSGSCCIVWDKSKTDSRYGQSVEATGIYLRLPDRKLVQAVWPEAVWLPVQKDEKRLENTESTQRIQPAENEQAAMPAEERIQELVKEPLPEPKQETVEKQAEEPAQEQYYGDKWEQLTHMYPLIHPFGDERAYLSIAPKDFVVLCRDYQKMVHNSFLLHGFYNYHHLLLGQIREKEEWHYYLGVPGNFYTREKMVAEMFGFEAFEGEKNPASPGDFGYYMKRVEI